MNPSIHIFGGGTFNYVRNNLALSYPAFGTTAKKIAGLCINSFPLMDIDVHLTRMANNNSNIVTDIDLALLVSGILQDHKVEIIFFTVNPTEYYGRINDVKSGKYASSLNVEDNENSLMFLTPSENMLKFIKDKRPDIILVGFHKSYGKKIEHQYDDSYKFWVTISQMGQVYILQKIFILVHSLRHGKKHLTNYTTG